MLNPMKRMKKRSAGRMMTWFASAAACAFTASPLLAQGSPAQAVSQMAPNDVASAASAAVQALGSAAKDKLLVKDLLGAQVTGPGGSTIGTVENFVVIPGGRVVAAIIATRSKKAGRIPVPFSIAKISHTAGKLGLSLPVSLSELQGMKEVQDLAKAIPGVK